MTKKVKICGLTRPEDIEAAIRHGADMLGLIVEAKSPRALSVKQAARLSRPALGVAKRVAVTVDASEKLIKQIAKEMRPDILQMHGIENPKWLREVKNFTNLPIIKAVKIGQRADLSRIKAFENMADYILLDAKPPKSSNQQGGHGRSFNWDLLGGIKSKTPLILAGGLSQANIKAAKQIANQVGINIFDVSSGLEATPGIKDHERIKAFMKLAKA